MFLKSVAEQFPYKVKALYFEVPMLFLSASRGYFTYVNVKKTVNKKEIRNSADVMLHKARTTLVIRQE